MKVALGSDLHLELDSARKLELPVNPEAEVLVLAGDIVNTEILERGTQTCPTLIEKFHQLSDMFKVVLVVMGNHEHYGGDFDKTEGLARKFYSQFDNFVFLEKETFQYNDVVFYGGTMWTDFAGHDPQVMWMAQNAMNDYSCKNSRTKHKSGRGSLLLPSDVLQDHTDYMTKLIENLFHHKDNNMIVISHHSPSMLQCPQEHRDRYDNGMNALYHNSHEEFILSNPQIRGWVHGHTHVRTSNKLGKCLIAANARGYAGHEKQADSFRFTEFEFNV
jgi:predicted phosphodiesterase